MASKKSKRRINESKKIAEGLISEKYTGQCRFTTQDPAGIKQGPNMYAYVDFFTPRGIQHRVQKVSETAYEETGDEIYKRYRVTICAGSLLTITW